MKCTVCGGHMKHVFTDLPFKVSEQRIVILKLLPVLQCDACTEYLIEDKVMQRIDTLLAATHSAVELEVIRFAA